MSEFRMSYNGLLRLITSCPDVHTVDVNVVYEKDEFEYSACAGNSIRHKPCLDADPGPIRLIYAVAVMENGGIMLDFIRPESHEPQIGTDGFPLNIAKKEALTKLARKITFSAPFIECCEG